MAKKEKANINRGKSITLDFNKKGYSKAYDFVLRESKFFGGKKATAIFELIDEVQRYRKENKTVTTITDINKNVVAKIKS